MPAEPRDRLTGFEFTFSLTLIGVVFGFLPTAYQAFSPLKDFLYSLGIAVSCLLAVAQNDQKSSPPLRWPFWLAVAAVLLLGVLPLGKAANAARHLQSAYFLLASGGVILCAAELADKRTGSIFLLRLWLVVGCGEALIVLAQFAGCDPFAALTGPAPVWRVYGTLGNPNLVAVLLVPLAILSLDGNLVQHSRVRFLSVSLLSLAVIATGSRFAALLLICGLWLAQLVSIEELPRQKVILAGVGTCLMLLAAFGVAFHMGKDFGSLGGRYFFWRAAVLLFRQSPLAGHGLGHFKGIYPQAAGQLSAVGGGAPPLALPAHAHNDWLEYAAEGGGAAFLLMASVVATVWTGWRTPSVSRYLSIAFGMMIIAAAWSSPLHAAPTALLFWSLFGLLSAGAWSGERGRGMLPVISLGLVFLLACGSVVMGRRVYGHWLAGRAEAAYTQGAIEPGKRLWEKAHQLAPGEGAFTYGWAWGLATGGDNARALRLAEGAAEIYANFDLYLLQASLLAREGRLEEARQRLVWMDSVFPGIDKVRQWLVKLETAEDRIGTSQVLPDASGIR